MGLLNFGNFYKKKSKKEARTRLSQPMPVPVSVSGAAVPTSLKLNLDPNDTNIIEANTFPQQQRNNSNTNAPAGSGSLFDDIFSELTTTSNINPVIQQDSMQNDISLAVALSQRLESEQSKKSTHSTTTATTTKKSNTFMSSSSDKNVDTLDFLSGGDSIYSRYLRNTSAVDGSMFDNLLGNNDRTAHTSAAASTPTTVITTTAPMATNVVLDSDISDPDEGSQNENSEGEDDGQPPNKNHVNQRMTKGIRPIMERRTQDSSRVLTQRVESNESVIDRMKDRHRNHVKLAALRQQQQQQQQQYNMMPHYMVAQPYGPPAAMSLPPNVVLPHPGMLMDASQMYYSTTPLNDYSEAPGSNPSHTIPPAPLPAGFLPHPTHATLAIPHKEKEDKDQHTARQTMTPTQSYSAPTSSARSRPSRSPPTMPLLPVSVTSSITSGKVNTQTVESASFIAYFPTDIDDDNADDDESIIYEQSFQPVKEEGHAIGADADADAESSDDEERKSVVLRKQKSMKKQHQKQQGADLPPLRDTHSNHYPQIRSSRSAPNLEKKQYSKKAGKSISRSSSSRRNSQETCTPPSELISTPPPLPINYEEELRYHLPRAHNHQQQQQQNTQYQPQSLRPMKSEPDLPRNSQNFPAQQQQQYYQGNQQMSYMPMYTSPLFYPSMMPYSGSNSSHHGTEAYSTQQDVAHRASIMSGYNYNAMAAYQQGHYYPSSSNR